ncbi:hypothetical protein BJ742DRAFT_151685 [Cladochytrium replicatum]|nr:hypothetical protein BJ742DRAFT_151685 [Cladochytrium replicatum]
MLLLLQTPPHFLWPRRSRTRSVALATGVPRLLAATVPHTAPQTARGMLMTATNLLLLSLRLLREMQRVNRSRSERNC